MYRIRFAAEDLSAKGMIELVEYPSIQLEARRRGDGSAEVLGVSDPPDVDVIVMQRITERHIADSISFFRAAGTAVVMDIDDHFQHVPPAHVMHSFLDPRRNPHSNWRHFKRACAESDLVVHSTPDLRVYANAHGRSYLLRNYVPERYLSIKVDEHKQLAVGWGGTTTIHPGDLEVTGGGVGQAVDDVGAEFINVGNGDGVRKLVGLKNEPIVTGIVPFDRYPREVARFDVGIAPLHDSVFSRAKTPLKALEYSALGVAWVGSRLPEYEWLQAEIGAGQLCNPRARDWYRAVRRLLTDREYRLDQQQVARAAVAEKFLLERNSWRWAEAWQLARENFERTAG